MVLKCTMLLIDWHIVLAILAIGGFWPKVAEFAKPRMMSGCREVYK